MIREPETQEEWQAAVNAVIAILALSANAATTYGLATINIARCGEILRRAKALGYLPPERLAASTHGVHSQTFL